MAYDFQAVDISLFDYHLVMEPLVNASAIKDDFNFLVDPTNYNQHYRSGTSVQTSQLRVFPLKWRSLSYHHFWKYYQTIWSSGGGYDFWRTQLPFIGKAEQTGIKLNSGLPNIKGTVTAFVLLSGIGWSTNLDVRLQGHMTPSQLRDFVGQFSKGNAGIFEINGTSKTAAGVFEYIGELVRKEVYASKTIDFLKIKRHSIVTLSSFTGPIATYQPSSNRMSAADRALFHSMLKGIPVTYDEAIHLENEKHFLLTPFYTGPDFAISYFDYGTLLFMQQTAIAASQANKAVRSKMRCHASNIRDYLIMTLDLYNFARDAKQVAATNPKVMALRKDVLETLQEIPNKYSNPLCQSFHSTFGPLRRV
jgi:hypothetical protein